MDFPSCPDLILVLPNQAKCRAQLTTGQTVVLGQLDLGFQPEFSLPVGAVNVHMDRVVLHARKSRNESHSERWSDSSTGIISPRQGEVVGRTNKILCRVSPRRERAGG